MANGNVGSKRDYVWKRRERTRTRVMYFLLGILLLTIIGTFSLVWSGRPGHETFTQTVLPLLTTLVGTALGFYFGGKDREDEDMDSDDEVTATPPEKSST